MAIRPYNADDAPIRHTTFNNGDLVIYAIRRVEPTRRMAMPPKRQVYTKGFDTYLCN